MFKRLKRTKRKELASSPREQKQDNIHIKKTSAGKLLREDFSAERMLHLFPVSIKEIGGNKWGYINSQGQFILPPVYDHACDFQENGLAIVHLKGQSGVINYSGYFIVKPIYDTIRLFSEGRAVVHDQQGFKIIDESGKEITSRAFSFIGDYHEGRALFTDIAADGNHLFGFLNKRGKEVIPITYEEAGNFSNGKALVKMNGGTYALINLTGKVICTYPYAFTGSYGEGLLAFQKCSGGLFGYLDEQGNTVIEPKYTSAEPFKEGRAIVCANGHYALIDRSGHYIFKPYYHDIFHLEEERIALGKAVNPEHPELGSIYAAADNAGHILTGFIYNGITKYEEGKASVCNDNAVFFIDRNGNRVSDFPGAEGRGELQLSKKLIKAVIDHRLLYFEKSGVIVWKPKTEICLNDQYIVNEHKYKPNKDFLIYYPQFNEMTDKKTQAKINQTLKDLAGIKETQPDLQIESNYMGDFTISYFTGGLAVIEMTGGNYPLGGSHRVQVKKYAHIDLKTGEFFQLKDLFKPGSQYVKVISEIIGERIKSNRDYSHFFPRSFKGIQADQPFFISKGHLNIFFFPNEIAPYQAGFPAFSIPFDNLMAVIDQLGAFWKTFN